MQNIEYKNATELNTPFFLFDVDHLTDQVRLIKKAFERYWNNALIAYSVKTNSLPFLSKMLLNQNIAAEVVSEDEFNLVNRIGFYGSDIVCNGPIKSKTWIDNILHHKCYLNIDSKTELDLVTEYSDTHPSQIIKVGLRVNNDIEDIFPNASTAGVNGSRFGFSNETGELEAAILELRSKKNIKIAGLHLHTSTNLRSLDVYRYIVDKFDKIVKAYSLYDIEYLDVGGGFYGEISTKPTWDDYLSAIAQELYSQKYSPTKLKIIIEPGVSLLSGCFSYYTKVVDVKDTKRSHWVLLDGSRTHIDPLMHKTVKNYFFTIVQNKETSQYSKPQVLAGYTCLEYDTFFQLENERELRLGDMIRFDKVGAYTLTFSPLFISWFPTVYYISNNKLGIAREKWTTDEFMQKSQL